MGQGMTAWYSIFVRVGDVRCVDGTAAGSRWECAKKGRMTRSAADGLMAQFALNYDCRLVRGKECGRVIDSRNRQT